MAINILNEIWPEWQIEKELGRGSYGVVYKAVKKTHNLESFSAIKVISIPLNNSEVENLRAEGLTIDDTKKYLKSVVDDFTKEIQLMESLKGTDNIVSVEDYKIVEKKDTIGWTIFIRMELLIPFNTYIIDKNLTEKEVADIGVDICTSLERCGQCNIIHRDLKPENIFVNNFGKFKLGDFGIARKMENVTGGLSQKGTYNYIAPEVVNSSNYDSRADIYSLGIILYRLMNENRLPFLNDEKQLTNADERRKAVERRIHGEKLERPSNASKEFSAVILRACEYNPESRYKNATEMKMALKNISNGNYKAARDYDELDETISVRKPEDAVNKTTKVNKPPNKSNDLKDKNSIGTFGNEPKNKSGFKKIAAIVIFVLCFSSVTAFAFPKLVDKINQKDEESEKAEETEGDKNEGTQYSKFDEEEIEKAIENADQLYNAGDVQGAISIIEANLAIYPNSKVLLDKQDEYSNYANVDDNQKEHDKSLEINISLNPSNNIQFPVISEGYLDVTEQTIAIRNEGRMDTGILTINCVGQNASDFQISKTSIDNLEPGKSDSFTIRPEIGLGAGVYTSQIKITGFDGIEKIIDVSVAVNENVQNNNIQSQQNNNSQNQSKVDNYSVSSSPKVFNINSDVIEDYSLNLDTSTYAKYDSGISDFSFYYPTNLYNNVFVDTSSYTDAYGENIESIVFSGNEGSELTYRILRRTDGLSIKDKTSNMLSVVKNELYEPNVIINSTVSDRGRVIVTGWDSNQYNYCYYNMVKIEGDYILQMLVKYPMYTDEEDKNQKFYVTECFYNLCGFSNTGKKVRSYKEYKEAMTN